MDYDLAIIGAGWAGFNAAIKAKRLGLKVALFEREQLGGTCLNRGCIPTKTLLQSAKTYSLAKKSKIFGVTTNPQINFTEIQIRKDRIIQQLRKGMEFMLKDINFFNTNVNLLSVNTIEMQHERIKAKFILIATGSRPFELKGLEFDGKKIISSDQILNLKEVPDSLLIIGGGVIGCEFATIFSALGCDVSIVELTHQLLPGLDKEIAKKIEIAFKKRGIKVSTNTDAKSLELKNYELILVCVGRIPLTEGLCLDKLDIKLDKNRIVVDDYLKTNLSNIYAAGDCASKTMLAHFAAYQGCIAVENIVKPSYLKAKDSNIPNCIFTEPEIGTVGISEEDAKNRNIHIKIFRFDFLGSGMARILEETDGFVKIISNSESEEILGASIIGPRATELIGFLTLAVQARLKVSRIRDIILAHPTLSETITSALRQDGY